MVTASAARWCVVITLSGRWYIIHLGHLATLLYVLDEVMHGWYVFSCSLLQNIYRLSAWLKSRILYCIMFVILILLCTLCRAFLVTASVSLRTVTAYWKHYCTVTTALLIDLLYIAASLDILWAGIKISVLIQVFDSGNFSSCCSRSTTCISEKKTNFLIIA